MKDIIQEAYIMIDNDDYACAVIRDGRIVDARKGRGVSPVLKLYDEKLLDGAVIVDKIIGKASAMILSHASVSEVYGEVVSESAIAWFEKLSIPCHPRTVTDRILNRTQTGLCPMEMTVMDIDNAEEGIAALRNTLARLIMQANSKT